eukprot:Skav216733  [mRNA]  locus=scaffold653:201057:205832:+ [translate_table: standard]
MTEAPSTPASRGSRLSSGHTWVQKSGFAMSLVSPLACASVFVLAKDIYVLEMAADIQEERSETESLCKITSGIGKLRDQQKCNALGLLPQLVVAANMTRLSLSLAGASFLLVGLISLVAVPVLRRPGQARQAFNADALPACLFWEYLEAWNQDLLIQPAFALLCMYRFFDGAVNTLLINGALYYYTFVSGLSGSDRSLIVHSSLLGAAQGLCTFALLPVWTFFFRKKRSVNINKVCSAACCVGLLAPIALWLLHGVLPDPFDFLVYFVLVGASLTGQTYWRAIVLCWTLGHCFSIWVVDEDCQAKAGRRREAIFVGCISLVSSTGRAAASGILLTALSAAGLEVNNCAQQCAGSDRDCRDDCEAQNFQSQDPAVATCVQFFYFAVIPSCQLIAIFLTYIFPIHSQRLELIYTNQEELYKQTLEVSNDAPSPAGGAVTAPDSEPVKANGLSETGKVTL